MRLLAAHLSPHTLTLRAAMPPPRCGPLVAELTLLPPGGQLQALVQQYFFLQLSALSIVAGLFFLVRPGSLLWCFAAADDEANLEGEGRLEDGRLVALCRPAGWLARCEITGERNLLQQPAEAVGLDVALAFEQGSMNECTLLRPSRLKLRGLLDSSEGSKSMTGASSSGSTWTKRETHLRSAVTILDLPDHTS